MPPRAQMDHIAIAAPELARGVELVQRTLGVSLQAGGEHARMATHNALLRLGDSVYLEVIAPDPKARAERPRWFGLDDLKPDTPPRLAFWAARTPDIRSTIAASAEPLGNVEAMSRDDLNWLISVPADGSLPFDGIAPALIEWPPAVQVARSLADVGCTLVKLEGFHPQAARISALLKSISVDPDAISLASLPAGQRPYLVAHIRTPKGLAKLSA